MYTLQALADSMSPSIDIVALEDSLSYRCDKCSNKSKSGEVRHPKANFRVLDSASWNASFGGEPFVYLLTAVQGCSDHESPRYVGIGKASCLMRRWTRMPSSEKHRFADGTLLHHMPATIPRLKRDFSDPAFQAMGAYFRLRVATINSIVTRLSVKDREEWLLPASLPAGVEARYALTKNFESRVISKLYSVGLSPWNETKGPTAALSSSLLARNLTIRSSGLPPAAA